MLAKWSCGHEVNSDNAYLKPTGDYGCIICRRAMQREASRLYRERKALEEARAAEEEAAAKENARRIAEIKRERSLRVVRRQETRTKNKKVRAMYVEDIMRNCTLAVSKASGLSLVQLTQKNRRPHVVVCRAVIFTLAREYNLSFPEIAAWANYDHSSVHHLVVGGFVAMDRCPGLFDQVIGKARAMLSRVDCLAA
jgi:chromosomal replication initiation ATPase DnaA